MKTLTAILMILCGTYADVASAQSSGFQGRWIVSSIHRARMASEWLEPKNLPAIVEIGVRDGRLFAEFTDQVGNRISCMTVQEIIEGNELILFGCPPPIKSNTTMSPLHRIKMREGNLFAIVITDRVIYRWTAKQAH